MYEILNALTGLLVSVATFVLALSVVPLLFKLFVPGIGDMVWRGYWGLLKWLFLIPFRLTGYLVQNAADRRRSR